MNYEYKDTKFTIFAYEILEKFFNMNQIREILITNDDSIHAEGIHVFAEIMRNYGNVTIVAPSEPQSGKASALSLGCRLYLNKIREEEGYREFTLNGTPVDCVKAALNECYNDRKMPDIIVSGINHGSNCSVAALYSGTLGACIEGTIYEIPSMGFSINTHSEHPDFSPVLRFGPSIIGNFLNHPPKHGIYLNVNFPDISADEVKGIKIARRGLGKWVEEFDHENDENGQDSLVMRGHFEDGEHDSSIGDHRIVHEGYISIVPLKIDHTDYEEMSRMTKEWNIL